jgi:hypothetical protein
MIKQLLISTFVLLITANTFLFSQQLQNIQHYIAAIEKDKFHGWPANNGAWNWDNEIVVGFTQGDFDIVDGHNLKGIQESKFSRSLDGGETWHVFDPDNFLDDDNIKWLPVGKKDLEKPMDFAHDGFAMRIFATGYHGNDDPGGGFYYSYDRGKTWNGPYFLGDINNHPELKGKTLTPRTDYIIMGKKECFIFVTVNADVNGENISRIACIKTENGGLEFDFVTWIAPLAQGARAIMPNTVQLSKDKFLLTYRKINIPKTPIESTIDAYVSNDRCKTWRFISTIKEIKTNSNPPAIVKLDDGRLCCIYGDRDAAKVCGKYSSDEGKTWGKEFVIREHYKSLDGWADMGYPRLVKRPDGKLVAMYYWASPDHPQHFIAASIWKP